MLPLLVLQLVLLLWRVVGHACGQHRHQAPQGALLPLMSARAACCCIARCMHQNVALQGVQARLGTWHPLLPAQLR